MVKSDPLLHPEKFDLAVVNRVAATAVIHSAKF